MDWSAVLGSNAASTVWRPPRASAPLDPARRGTWPSAPPAPSWSPGVPRSPGPVAMDTGMPPRAALLPLSQLASGGGWQTAPPTTGMGTGPMSLGQSLLMLLQRGWSPAPGGSAFGTGMPAPPVSRSSLGQMPELSQRSTGWAPTVPQGAQGTALRPPALSPHPHYMAQLLSQLLPR